MVDDKDVKRLRDKGFTYQQIGDKLGVSRQRVHQISKRIDEWDNSFRYSKRPRKKKIKCRGCGETFLSRPFRFRLFRRRLHSYRGKPPRL